MRLQGCIQKDLLNDSANGFLAFAGLEILQEEDSPFKKQSPRWLAEFTWFCAKWSYLLPSTQLLAAKVTMAGCFCHLSSQLSASFPQPFLESNIHLQLLGYRKAFMQNVLQHHMQIENDGGALRAGTHLHYRRVLETNNEGLL